MSRRQFYEVNKEAFLFPLLSQPNSERANPEEFVRQWCAYELIRAYGVFITDMQFERPVRVGSKTYRIDILVSKGGDPWIIVECKEPSYAKHGNGMAQAISYADAQEIGAEFAIYTNGQIWNVQRRIHDKWVPVPDLPPLVFEQWNRPITELLRTVREVSPLLHKLDQPIEGKDAEKFLIAMQRFFYGWNLLTESGNKNLHFGTDNLLRVLTVGKNDPRYSYDKLEAARYSYETFRSLAGFPYSIYPVDGNHLLSFEIQQLHVALQGMAEGTRELAEYDALLLRLNVALLEYGCLWSGSKEPFPAIGSNLHSALRAFLSYALISSLNVSLPDTIDNILTGDLRSGCQLAWEEIRT